MKIIISPAKKMVETNIEFQYHEPIFLSKAHAVLERLRSLNFDELKILYKTSDNIVNENIQRLKGYHIDCKRTPAILAYKGLQYTSLDQETLDENAISYLKDNLYILSALYGVLRPFDSIIQYRLEMQAKLSVDGFENLYTFWASSFKQLFNAGDDLIINLASDEYASSVVPLIDDKSRVVNIVFVMEKDGKLVSRSTMCKMARGIFLRYMAKNNIKTLDEIKKFNKGFKLLEEKGNKLIFLKDETC